MSKFFPDEKRVYPWLEGTMQEIAKLLDAQETDTLIEKRIDGILNKVEEINNRAGALKAKIEEENYRIMAKKIAEKHKKFMKKSFEDKNDFEDSNFENKKEFEDFDDKKKFKKDDFEVEARVNKITSKIQEVNERVENLYNQIIAKRKKLRKKKIIDEIRKKREEFRNKNVESKIDELHKEIIKRKLNANFILSEEKVDKYSFKVTPDVKEIEDIKVQKYEKKPKEIERDLSEAPDFTKPSPEIVDKVKELKDNIEKIQEITSKVDEITEQAQKIAKEAYDAFMKPKEEEVRNLGQELERIDKAVANALAQLIGVNKVAKLSDNMYVGLIEKIKGIEKSKKYGPTEQKNIDEMVEKIKALKEKLDEYKEKAGKFTEVVKEVKIAIINKETKASLVEIKAEFIDKIEKFNKLAEVAEEVKVVLFDIFNIFNELDKTLV